MNVTQTWDKRGNTFTKGEIAEMVSELKLHRDNMEAVSKLYLTFVDNIYRFFRNRVPFHSDVHDLTSETFVIMLKNLEKLEKNECFHSWLFGIALNLLRKYYKRKKRETEDMVHEGSSDFQSFVWDAPATYPLPDSVVDQKYLRIYLSDVMSKMKKEQQLVLYLRFYEEMKVKEIAEQMGKSEEAIKSLLFRSQKTLHKLLLKKSRSRMRKPLPPMMSIEALRSFATIPY